MSISPPPIIQPSVPAGTDFTTQLTNPPGITAADGVGARIEIPPNHAIATAFVQGTLDPVAGVWNVTIGAPSAAGNYQLVWKTTKAVDPQPFPLYIPLVVTTGPVTPTVGGEPDYPDVQPSDVRPTLAQVAILERTRTRGDDGTFYGTFTPQTWPTDTDVNNVIDTAVDMILAQLRADFNPTFYSQVSDLIALQTAVLIEASFFRNQDQAQATSAWRELLSAGMTGLQASIEVDREQAVVFAGMEPRQPDWDTDPWLRNMGP